jgi:hypothetical protein
MMVKRKLADNYNLPYGDDMNEYVCFQECYWGHGHSCEHIHYFAKECMSLQLQCIMLEILKLYHMLLRPNSWVLLLFVKIVCDHFARHFESPFVHLYCTEFVIVSRTTILIYM